MLKQFPKLFRYLHSNLFAAWLMAAALFLPSAQVVKAQSAGPPRVSTLVPRLPIKKRVDLTSAMQERQIIQMFSGCDDDESSMRISRQIIVEITSRIDHENFSIRASPHGEKMTRA